MLKLADFECPECGDIQEVMYDHREQGTVTCQDCNVACDKLVGAPAIHTLETHFRGYQGNQSFDKRTGAGYYNPSHGEFIDENLCDKNTGKPLAYKSLREKEKLLHEQGLYAKEDVRSEKKDRFKTKQSKKPMIFTGHGKKGIQYGG